MQDSKNRVQKVIIFLLTRIIHVAYGYFINSIDLLFKVI